MKRTLPILALLASGVLMFTACDNRSDVQEAREDLSEEQQDVRDAQREGAEQVMKEQRDVYMQEINVRVARLDSTMEVVEERAEKAKGKMKTEYEAQLAELRTRRDSFNTKMDDIRNATVENWESVKADANTVLGDLERKYNEVLENMKSN